MSFKIGRFVNRFIVIIVLILLAVAVLAVHLVRSSYPNTSGEVRISGLKAPVEVFRDSYGVPHIYASNDPFLRHMMRCVRCAGGEINVKRFIRRE